MFYSLHIRLFVAIVFVFVLFSGLGAERKKPNRQPKSKVPPPIRLPEAVIKPHSGSVMNVAPLDRSRRKEIHKAAIAIDSLLVAHWTEHGEKESPRLKDDQFVRRIYLELGGRIPTLDETIAFLDSPKETKRADLIDTLLESPDYVSHFYNFWADILRLCERPQKQLFFEPYLDYVKRSIASNTPFDAWAYEMLTADGRLWESPAVGYQLRDEGMPLPYVDNTVRVFLGTQIGCAQCHDHPFDDWTQHQFYELAALTAGTRSRSDGKESPKDSKSPPKKSEKRRQLNPVGMLIKEAKEKAKGGKVDNQFIQFLRANGTSVAYTERPLNLPHDYAYQDAQPLDTVQAKVLWGEVPKEAQALDGRHQMAAWMTGRDNRQFARTIANRLWKKVMGVGLVEPVDDFRPENPASYPALLEHLTDEMLRLNFDLREFVRVLVSTDTYQRRAVLHDPTSETPFRFPAPSLKRMTAEQIWDSILVLVARDTWAFQRPSVAEFRSKVSLDLASVDLVTAERIGDLYRSNYSPPIYSKRLAREYGYKGQILVRASELPAPLPLGHFLRQFGQSDRESIEGSRTVATIPQILSMFNGPITHSMLERGSVIYDNVTAAGPQKGIDVIFLSILSHRPSSEDRQLATKEVMTAENPATGYGNVIWSLLNTREFIFIQ